MKSLFQPRWCHGLVLAISVLWMGSSPCRASATYSFTDLGKLRDGGNPVFDSQGQVSPTLNSPEDWTHQRSGPYSLLWHTAQAPPHDLHRALALQDGLSPVEIKPPTLSTYEATIGYAANANGIYVGMAYSDGMFGRQGNAFMFTRSAGSQLVPTPYQGSSSAFSINDAGLIVGTSHGRAFLSDGKSAWDLNILTDPGKNFLLTSATDINDRGQILGLAFDSTDNSIHEILLSPTAVPEPSSLMLVATGCLLLGWRRWAGRRARAPGRKYVSPEVRTKFSQTTGCDR